MASSHPSIRQKRTEKRGAIAPAIGLLLATLWAGPSVAAAQTPIYSPTYAQDRAEIEDLYGRYEFAFDWGDADTYVSMFAEDGVIETAFGQDKGREALRAFCKKIAATRNAAAAKDTPSVRRVLYSLNITNLVLKVNGNRATARAYWIQLKNTNPKREAVLAYYGHYEDELEKINGHWLFKYRKIYNENRDEIASKGPNPAW